jgi:hypothetical protein
MFDTAALHECPEGSIYGRIGYSFVHYKTCPQASTLGVLIHLPSLFTLREENGLDDFVKQNPEFQSPDGRRSMQSSE